MSEKPAEFGVTFDGDRRPTAYLSKPLALWRDAELEAGIHQVAARIRRHPRFRLELERLERDLLAEQQRRRDLYADVAAALLGDSHNQDER